MFTFARTVLMERGFTVRKDLGQATYTISRDGEPILTKRDLGSLVEIAVVLDQLPPSRRRRRS